MEDNRRREKEAFSICEKKIAAHKLEMKLVDVEYTFLSVILAMFAFSPNRFAYFH